ncbi:HAD family hydrolase [Halomarina ordinaria]|uniref:HAD family hydrolase n=1 Tax=Halomarina ordinaria TaxID=3033939 RepID=A0ABD5UAT6_9EURY|nr:HAD family hydrolase [Halomarina sp. PSRA2]
MADYDGVFFDIGGVLLDLPSVRTGYVTFLERFAAEQGIDDTDRLVADWRDALGSYFSGREGTTYRTARPGYQRALDEAVGREVPEEEWFPLFAATTLESVQPADGAEEVVSTLAETGHYLGVISDIDTWEAERILGKFGVLRHVDHVTTSEEVGRTKPDPAMFETALGKAPDALAPTRSLYVGDRYDHDMRGGSRAGFVTVAHGGSAAERAATDPDDAVDHVVADLRGLLDLAGARR